MNMNKLFLLVGLLSAGVAVGQTKDKTTKMSSSTTSTSNYNNSNTSNYNSQNATSGTNSSTNGTSGSMNTMGSGSTGSNTTGSMNTMGSMSSDMNSTTQPSGSMGSTTNGTYNNSTSVTPSGTNNYNTTTGANGATTTTPTTSGNYNNAGSTSNTTYSTATTNAYPREKKDYKNFSYGIYVGVNSTHFQGEKVDANGSGSGLTGRLGYQAGFFVRGGGRLFGQIGAEYFASSSDYFTSGQGTTIKSINDKIDIKYIQVPVYVGYKLTESDRGISSIRVQVGLEYANQIGSTAGQFGNLNNLQYKSGTFNGLGQLGFDAGPVFLDLTYHYGFSNAIEQNAGFAGSQRRILSASVGFKF